MDALKKIFTFLDSTLIPVPLDSIPILLSHILQIPRPFNFVQNSRWPSTLIPSPFHSMRRPEWNAIRRRIAILCLEFDIVEVEVEVELNTSGSLAM
ncbi:hypothetical protein BV898_06266 [Hypsibius exemplaris]|uniref:Uncharacterized protein n=1 Tax=Hypsibius exemplaris TaxID=2072580 RepID=A0A1W0WWZ7_HYPEX|nr:hypothetical protein BV898_06266 [Hypsibius exemplaris]